MSGARRKTKRPQRYENEEEKTGGKYIPDNWSLDEVSELSYNGALEENTENRLPNTKSNDIGMTQDGKDTEMLPGSYEELPMTHFKGSSLMEINYSKMKPSLTTYSHGDIAQGQEGGLTSQRELGSTPPVRERPPSIVLLDTDLFLCQRCNSVFEEEDEYLGHIETDHTTGKFYCLLCYMQGFQTPYLVVRHMFLQCKQRNPQQAYFGKEIISYGRKCGKSFVNTMTDETFYEKERVAMKLWLMEDIKLIQLFVNVLEKIVSEKVGQKIYTESLTAQRDLPGVRTAPLKVEDTLRSECVSGTEKDFQQDKNAASAVTKSTLKTTDVGYGVGNLSENNNFHKRPGSIVCEAEKASSSCLISERNINQNDALEVIKRFLLACNANAPLNKDEVSLNGESNPSKDFVKSDGTEDGHSFSDGRAGFSDNTPSVPVRDTEAGSVLNLQKHLDNNPVTSNVKARFREPSKFDISNEFPTDLDFVHFMLDYSVTNDEKEIISMLSERCFDIADAERFPGTRVLPDVGLDCLKRVYAEAMTLYPESTLCGDSSVKRQRLQKKLEMEAQYLRQLEPFYVENKRFDELVAMAGETAAN